MEKEIKTLGEVSAKRIKTAARSSFNLSNENAPPASRWRRKLHKQFWSWHLTSGSTLKIKCCILTLIYYLDLWPKWPWPWSSWPFLILGWKLRFLHFFPLVTLTYDFHTCPGHVGPKLLVLNFRSIGPTVQPAERKRTDKQTLPKNTGGKNCFHMCEGGLFSCTFPSKGPSINYVTSWDYGWDLVTPTPYTWSRISYTLAYDVLFKCSCVHAHKCMDCWQLFRINKSWIIVRKRRSRENFWNYILSNANFQIPWDFILWSPHNGYLDPPIKGYWNLVIPHRFVSSPLP